MVRRLCMYGTRKNGTKICLTLKYGWKEREKKFYRIYFENIYWINHWQSFGWLYLYTCSTHIPMLGGIFQHIVKVENWNIVVPILSFFSYAYLTPQTYFSLSMVNQIQKKTIIYECPCSPKKKNLGFFRLIGHQFIGFFSVPLCCCCCYIYALFLYVYIIK